MIDHPSEERLNDFVDGTLTEAAGAEVDAHLAGCRRCAEEIRLLRELLADASAMAQPAEPARDLWPEIAARLEPAFVLPLEPRRRRRLSARWSNHALLAMAAGLLVVATATATAFVVRATGPAPSPIAAGTDSPPAAFSNGARLVGQVDAGFEQPIRELQAELAARRDLPPEVAAVIEENLRIIEDAIAAARAALAAAPADPGLARELTNTYEIKVDLLEQAVRLPRQI